ncbi:energy-coupling factor transporter ATPase [Texcoconibacillus texcoconensis]|uniref:Energy-coupling factor transport system ATP-binding protein n=1 Tax=Texcoconibacillus texcoconensis TaxID=1095777 RepID=A0A840QTS8_9BACI|nr:energy-coupling factor transporter ATPase [Texcoconibacillus texcoconensis]MBB5174956.1 energy-coupling factor transport system ATP-binding protein [Texcoconibacillus texcoconensis]
MVSLLAVNNVSFRYQPEMPLVIKGINLTINEGEWLAVVGHNGSGKSTLAKMLNGLLQPEEGSVVVDGLFTNHEKDLSLIRKKVGMVFQNPENQMVATTVKDDVAFGLENIAVPSEEMKDRIENSLKKVGMSGYENAEPHHLSGGQKQRVAIAGVLAMKPSIIVLDEATSMLDPEGKTHLREVMKQLQVNEGISVVSITHDLEEMRQADRVVVMKEGAMIAEGTSKDVLQQKDLLEQAGLMLPLPARVGDRLKKEKGWPLPKSVTNEEELVEALWTLKQKN